MNKSVGNKKLKILQKKTKINMSAGNQQWKSLQTASNGHVCKQQEMGKYAGDQ